MKRELRDREDVTFYVGEGIYKYCAANISGALQHLHLYSIDLG